MSWINCQHVVFGSGVSGVQLMWRQSQVTTAPVTHCMMSPPTVRRVQLILLLTCLIARLSDEWARHTAAAVLCFAINLYICCSSIANKDCMKTNKKNSFLFFISQDAKRGVELDYIISRKNPLFTRPVYLELWGSPLFAIRQKIISPEMTEGTIFLLGPLDFEKQSMYHLSLLAIVSSLEWF